MGRSCGAREVDCPFARQQNVRATNSVSEVLIRAVSIDFLDAIEEVQFQFPLSSNGILTEHQKIRPTGQVISESRIDRFAFQRQNAEDALMYPPQRFALNESLQAFQPQSKLSQSQRTLGG